MSEALDDIATVEPAAIVLDTNTVLDWLVFKDPVVDTLMAHLQAGTIRWFACPSMRVELVRTLGYRKLQRWAPEPDSALLAYDRLITPADEPPRSVGAMRCSDADDQVFIDLALVRRARWLVSKDRAVLKLARRARAWNLAIIPPKDWSV